MCCNYFSCIVVKTEAKALWSTKTVGHEDLVREYSLNDNPARVEERAFVRVEITPNDPAKVTRERKDWSFKIDEQATAPRWWSNSQEEKAWVAWEESVKKQVLLDGE